MAVGPDDVRHIAALARLGVTEERIPSIVAELNGILEHMDVLQKVDTTAVPPASEGGVSGMPLRSDDGGQIPLARDRRSFAPGMRDGFFLVPRLHTHDALGATADASESADGG